MEYIKAQYENIPNNLLIFTRLKCTLLFTHISIHHINNLLPAGSIINISLEEMYLLK